MPLVVHDDPPPALADAVDAGLHAHNLAAAPTLADVRPLGAFALGGDGRPVGGAVGRTWGACCELQQLWVDDARRGAGLGTALVRAFDQRARERGCRVFDLTTFSFQAPDFYRRLGYAVVAEHGGHGAGIHQCLMRRTEP